MKSDNCPVILITGTSKGIGKDLIDYYTNRNYIVIGCSRSGIKHNKPNYIDYKLDVTNESDVKSMFYDIKSNYRRLDVLINNAGISLNNLVVFTPLAEAQLILNTNFIGTFIFCREAVKLMLMKKYGKIINISSLHSSIAIKGAGMYGASKAAVEQLSKVLANEVNEFGITVNVLCLSIVRDTGMEKSLSKDIKNEIFNNTETKRYLEIKKIINNIDDIINDKCTEQLCRILS